MTVTKVKRRQRWYKVEIPKYRVNGCLVAKSRNGKVKRLSRERVKSQVIGERNGVPL